MLPTDSELEILQVLWQNGPTTVRFVNEKLNEQRDVGYTTTLKIMQIMTDKGLCGRNTDERIHVYHAIAQEKDTQNRLLDTFVGNTFRGSAMQLVMQALGNHQTSKAELDEIKSLIKQLENQN